MENTTYEFGAVPPDLLQYVKNKQRSAKYYFQYFLDRTKMMFAYKNLPDTLEHSMLERYLQMNGICCVTDYEGKLYAFNGSCGGERDVYYRPTLFVVSNPHLKETFSKNIVISNEFEDYNKQPLDSQPGVLMRNDSEWMGLTPLIARYSVLMAENCLTIRSADIMLRIIALITASSDKSLQSALDYLRRLENGDLGVISGTKFGENVEMQSPPSNNGSYLTQFIELQQYLKGSFFNEIGLRANYNMKREAIGEGESTLDEESCIPLCENMLLCRREDVKKINDMYGTSIEVDFSSAWLESQLERSIVIASQIGESGMGQVEVNDGESGQVVADGKEGEKDDIDRNDGEESGTGGSEFSEGESSEAGSRSESGEAFEQERTRKENKTGERSASSGDGKGAYEIESEGSGDSDMRIDKSERYADAQDDGKISEINDISSNEFLDKVHEAVKDAELTSKEEGVEENGFLGETEGPGNEDVDTNS